MHAKTKTFTMFAIVAVTGLALITASSFTSDSVLAVKTSSSHKRTSSSSSSSGTVIIHNFINDQGSKNSHHM